jgi:hypothetical protein
MIVAAPLSVADDQRRTRARALASAGVQLALFTSLADTSDAAALRAAGVACLSEVAVPLAETVCALTGAVRGEAANPPAVGAIRDRLSSSQART